MALLVTHPDKFGTGNLEGAIVVVAGMYLDFSAQSGRIVYNVFKSQEAFMAGSQVYDQVALTLPKDGLKDADDNVLIPPFADLVRERVVAEEDSGKTVFQVVAEILYQKGLAAGLFSDPVDAGLPY